MTDRREDIRAFVGAVESGEPERLREAFRIHPRLRDEIDGPHFAFDSPAVVAAKRNLPLLDVLLEHGADINARSRWWAGGFGVLDFVALTPEDDRLAEALIARGAIVGVHAAAGLGRLERLRELLDADPGLVAARGGDGATPLHFARTVEVAALLLDRGADIDARDVDHESTAAQHRLTDRAEVAHFLVARGCATDLLLAAALGDLALVQHHLAADPGCIRLRVSDECFPLIGKNTGGHIYQWTLGWYVSPHQVARERGHVAVYEHLMSRSPDSLRLLEKCWEGDEPEVERILATGLRSRGAFSPAEERLVAHAARNDLAEPVRLFLRAGLPVDATSQHRATPLHWAGFHGNAAMAAEILRYHPPLEAVDADFQGTPLGWAAYGSTQAWNVSRGDYPRTVELLLAAGARPREPMLRCASEPVARILRAALGAA